MQIDNCLQSAYLIVMMPRMFHFPSNEGLNRTRGYEREVPTGEAALFGVLLVLPVVLLLILSLVAG
jgi:hypothetical protein